MLRVPLEAGAETMNWAGVAAVADILAAIGVVASLVYVARQIHQNSTLISQNSELAKAERLHETNVSYTNPYALIAQDKELAQIYRRGKNGEALEADEYER